MPRFLLGCLFGILSTSIVLVVFADVQNTRSERQLIEHWRQLQPGQTRTEVIECLGKPLYEFAPGEEFPEWAQASVTNDYNTSHGLLVFITQTPGPQLLLVFVDTNNQVSFVSSVPT